MPAAESDWLNIRPGRDEDLAEVAAMIDDFVKGHPAEHHPRPIAKLRAALFGDAPVAHLLVATRRRRIIGMAQWFLTYDVFWAMYGSMQSGYTFDRRCAAWESPPR